MYKYIILYALLAPLVGVYLVEQGAYAMSVGKAGFPNGTFYIYSVYVVVIVATIFFVNLLGRGGRKEGRQSLFSPEKSKMFNSFGIHLFILHIALIFIMLFVFGGINVWLGVMEKGAFRVKLGPFGAIAYILTKYTSPTLFAYLTVLFLNSHKTRFQKILWWSNVVLIFILGSTWGFKSTGISMMLPSLLIIFWRISFFNIIKLGGVFFAILFLFFYWFDSETNLGSSNFEVFSFIIERLTVLQGDASWYIWGEYQDGAKFPNYFPSLLAGIGDSNLKILGVSRDNLYEWMNFHYDWMLSYVSGLPLETIDGGHSIVGTPFSEGLIAGGKTGIIVIAIVAGVIISVSYHLMDRFRLKKQYIFLTLFSSYFCFNVFPWLMGGGITQLYHISNVIGFIITLLFLKSLKMKINFEKLN